MFLSVSKVMFYSVSNVMFLGQCSVMCETSYKKQRCVPQEITKRGRHSAKSLILKGICYVNNVMFLTSLLVTFILVQFRGETCSSASDIDINIR